MSADWRLAVDIGGTFTDVVLFDATSGRVVVEKTLTTPSAPLDGVRAGVTQLLAKAGVRPADITQPIVHATTLITNALIEAKQLFDRLPAKVQQQDGKIKYDFCNNHAFTS
jgi:N-methylhydantoinase A